MSEPAGSAQSAAYEIKDGRIITTIGGTPFDVVVYKVGDKYIAARGSEFGFANYEVQAVPAAHALSARPEPLSAGSCECGDFLAGGPQHTTKVRWPWNGDSPNSWLASRRCRHPICGQAVPTAV